MEPPSSVLNCHALERIAKESEKEDGEISGSLDGLTS